MSISIDAKLCQVVEAAYANAPAVKARFDAAGLSPADVQTVADLNKVPILSKDEAIALQQADPPFGGMLAVPMHEVRHIFMSPGPIYEPDAGDHASQSEMAQLSLQQIGFEPGDVVLNALSYHLVPAGLMLDEAAVGVGCTVIPAGVGNSEIQLKLMQDFGVTAYVGTPSYLMSLIKKAEEQGLDFKTDFKVTKALVSAEPLPPALRETLVNEYGITVGNAYATAELGVLALNLAGGMAMQLMPEPIIQVIDTDTGLPVGPGEAGEVVVTNFNTAYPLIRFGTGDMAMNMDPNPGQSKQEERAVMLVGRSGEAIKVRGMFIHPNQLRFVISQITQATGVQGVVTRPDTRDQFTVRVALADASVASPELAEQIRQAIPSVCRVRPDEVVFVDAIEEGARGMVDARQWA